MNGNASNMEFFQVLVNERVMLYSYILLKSQSMLLLMSPTLRDGSQWIKSGRLSSIANRRRRDSHTVSCPVELVRYC